jgi:RNA polymerase sigma-70 factor (ECF subfamily)
MQDTNPSVGTELCFEIPVTDGATRALEQLLSGGVRSFYRTAFRLLGNAADAEDAVQEALLAAYTHLDQFKGQSQMSTWLTSIVLNCARMQLRRRLRHVYVSLDEPIGDIPTLASERLADHRPSPEDEYRDSELSARCTGLHNQLSPVLRTTFQLRIVDGLSIRETARILGIPSGTVKARSARARQKLKKLMQRALRSQSRRVSKN